MMKKLGSVLLALVLLCASVTMFTVSAEDATADTAAVTAELTTDKAAYTADEKIVATVTVKNGTAESIVNVNTGVVVPEGYQLAEGALNTATAALVKAGEETLLTAIFEKVAPATTTTVTKDTPKNDAPKTGDTTHVVLAVVLALGAVAAMTIAIRSGKGRQLLSLTLVCAMALTAAAAVPAVKAEETALPELSCDVTVDGAALTLTATVTYEVAPALSDTDKVLDGAKLVAYGDSLTAFGTWPLSVAENCNMYLFNGAMGGINTDEALGRFDKYVLTRDADFVTLCFGMNDLLMTAKNKPQVTPEQFKENLKTMCEQIKEAGATPILLTSSYLDESKFYSSQGQNKANYADVGGPLAWLDVYNEKTRELAAEGGYHLVDIRKACDDYTPAEFLADDGIHLGDIGNQVYTDAISAYLKAMFVVDENAEQITTRFPYVASPAEPATLDIISYDPAMWDTPNAGEMTFANDANGALLIANTTGMWPEAHYAANTSVLVPMNGTELVYDFSTANVNTSIILFFGGATPFATTEGKYVVINNKLGANTEPYSGDILANQTVKGSVKLTDLGIPASALDENGNLLISGVKVFAAGTKGQNVTIRQLAVSTTGAPVQ